MQREALEILYRNHCREIFRFVRRYVSTDEMAHDLVQDVFYRAIEYVSRSHSPVKNARAWLYAIARNECFAAGRKKMSETDATGNYAARNNVLLRSTEEEVLEKIEVDEIFSFVAGTFSEKETAAFYFYVFEQMNQEEIALVLKSSQSAISRILIKVTERVKEQFKSEKERVKRAAGASYG